jgi:hypothetical protein
MQAIRDAAVTAAEKTHATRCAAERAIEDAEYAKLPAVVRNLMTAHKLGRLQKHTECLDILADLSTCLANGSSRALGGRSATRPRSSTASSSTSQRLTVGAQVCVRRPLRPAPSHLAEGTRRV